MAGASKALDPIAAAEAGIAGSKDLIAAVARDLGQHQRWLAHYDVAEKRHARRVMLQNVLWRLEWARRRLMRRLARFGVRVLRLAHLAAILTAEFLLRLAAALNRAASAAVAWLSPRAHALYRGFARYLAAASAWSVAASRALASAAMRYAASAWAWSVATSRALANAAMRYAAAAWAWSVATSRALGSAAMRYAAATSVWLGLHARIVANRVEQLLAAALARTLRESRRVGRLSRKQAISLSRWPKTHARTATIVLREWLSAGAGRTVAGMRTLSRAVSATASDGLSWARKARKEWLRSYAAGPATAIGETNHRALVVRRSTALICFEAKRPGLPALRPG